MSGKPEIDATQREQSLIALRSEEFDVLVIGAGITGCGIARDAAMRGMKVALVDARDLAGATSSRSSKLIHGGIRYMAQGQVHVVKEAANERRTIRRIAPHLSLTNPMVVLSPNRAHLATMRTGIWAYEKLGNVVPEEKHVAWNKKELAANEPAVKTGGLAGAAVYPEYQTEDSRLTVANARSAAGHGATIVTWAPVEDIILENGKAVGAKLRDALVEGSEPFEVRANVVVNAAGTWVDFVRRMEEDSATKKMQLTKGIHVIFSRDRLPFNGTVCWSAPDGRGLFAVPRGRFVYIGTTDTFYSEPGYWPEITREDVDYLVGSLNSIIDVAPMTDTDIVGMWAGVRPLLGEEGKSPSEISRRHEFMTGPGGMITVAGGKLTAYRSMAERTVDKCQEALGVAVTSAPTDTEALPGGDFRETFEELKEKVESQGIKPDDAERLARLYGAEALALFAEETGPAVEAEFAVKVEGALTLEDYWVRRSARSTFDDNGGMAALELAAEMMGELLGWSEEEKNKQIDACRGRREKIMSILNQ